ncbi:MAG: 4Fe-4S dicluster domain-containing protein [Nitrospinaceae bacterium]|nr:4Fe-4S dicluster domain-containing protein [Nitrospinaceae bacterium]
MPEDREIGRKDFFKEGPLSLIRAFMEGSREEPPPKSPPANDIPRLRPPGALPESVFLKTCEGGGACAEACPAVAISLVPRDDDPTREAPMIEPGVAACVLCDDLSCMKTCPSGALELIPREAIRIGIVKIDRKECFAWSGLDVFCDYCTDRCPVGESAIQMVSEGELKGPLIGEACTGCGVCEYHCPTYPAAVQVFELADEKLPQPPGDE